MSFIFAGRRTNACCFEAAQDLSQERSFEDLHQTDRLIHQPRGVHHFKPLLLFTTTHYQVALLYTQVTMLRSITLFLLLSSCAKSFTSPFTRGTRLDSGVRQGDSLLFMKTIAVFGASGLTASECVYQALENGDVVVGLTRNPSKCVIPKGSGGANAGKPLENPNLTLIGGDVTKKADVDKVFDAAKIDGVVVALGGKTSDVGDSMLTDGTKNVIDAMKDKGVKRLAVVTSIGAGDSEKQAPFFFKSALCECSVVCLFLPSSRHQHVCSFCLSLFLYNSPHDDGHEENLCRQECSRKGGGREWIGILHCASGWTDCRCTDGSN